MNSPAKINPLFAFFLLIFSIQIQAQNAFEDFFGNTGGQQEFLPVEQAFVAGGGLVDEKTLVVQWSIAEGYYLYQEKFNFTLIDPPNNTIKSPVFPEGKIKHDDYFGEMVVYYDRADILLPLANSLDSAQPATLSVEFQGCAEGGICYAPTTYEIPIDMSMTVATETAAPATQTKTFESEQDQIIAFIEDSSLLLALAAFFGLGLLAAFTPCIFPLVPVLSSIIVGQGEHITTRKAFTLSLTYVIAQALVWGALGAAVANFNENFQAYFQDPVIISLFVIIVIALALSMFGFYEIQVPSFIQTKLTEISHQQEGGTYAGVAIMGLLSGMIVGPCLSGPLYGLLLVIATKGNIAFGFTSMLLFGLGIGLPLLVLGSLGGQLLPKAGDWMNSIKAFFGVLLLGLAIYLLERIISEDISIFLWGALLIGSSVYLGALEQLGLDATGWSKFWKGIGLLALVYGVILVIGGAIGNSSLKQPLQLAIQTQAATTASDTAVEASSHIQFNKIKSSEDLDAALQGASINQQYAMLDFYADWCIDCKRMERITFADEQVQSILDDVALLQADVTKNDRADRALQKKLGVFGPPSILFFDRDGNEIKDFRLAGFKSPEDFRQHVKDALNH